MEIGKRLKITKEKLVGWHTYILIKQIKQKKNIIKKKRRKKKYGYLRKDFKEVNAEGKKEDDLKERTKEFEGKKEKELVEEKKWFY